MSVDYRIVQDPEYGYLRLDPVPSRADVERYYSEEFYSGEYRQFNDSSLQVQEEERAFFESRWAEIAQRLEELTGPLPGRSIFDVGCGFAQALQYFRGIGMEVAGLEPSPEGSEHARSLGLEVFRAGIEELEVAGERRFDVVTLLNVLEHLREPADTLARIQASLLKPGGVLVIDVPNEFNDFQTAANEEYGLGEWWVCAPNHINYFTPESLSALLERSGYQVRAMESSFPLEMFLLMGDVYVGNAELGREVHAKRCKFEATLRKQGKASTLRRFYEGLAGLGLGRQITMYASTSRSEGTA